MVSWIVSTIIYFEEEVAKINIMRICDLKIVDTYNLMENSIYTF